MMTHPVAVRIWPKRLFLGRGSLATLPKVMAELGVGRALVLCGRTVASGALLARMRAALGPLCCGVFDGVAAHTPLPMVESAMAQIAATGADVVISVGGGSAIDAGKGAVLLTATGGACAPYAIRYAAGDGMRRALLPAVGLKHIAVPTTAGSASEVLPTSAIRDVERRSKMLFWDDALIPDAVILDPEMAAATGAFLTAASGMTAVARCVESLYSSDRNALAEGLALHALRLLQHNLPLSVERPDDLDARLECQVACAMSGIASINAMVSLVHALGHVVGGRYALQHGVSHAILLAPAMRRLLPAIGARQGLVLEALGGDGAGDPDAAGARAAERIAALVARLPLNGRLRELGIPAEELDEIAETATHDYMMANLPAPVSLAEIGALLRAAW